MTCCVAHLVLSLQSYDPIPLIAHKQAKDSLTSSRSKLPSTHLVRHNQGFPRPQVATKVEGNPIMQDEKKGKARLYHGPIFWNYGCLPQTWEDPNVKGDENVDGAFGDDDPVDVVEIGAASLAMGSFTPVKVLGCLSMIDDGELDWKVPFPNLKSTTTPTRTRMVSQTVLFGISAHHLQGMHCGCRIARLMFLTFISFFRSTNSSQMSSQIIAIAASDEHADKINDVGDIEEYYPGTVSGIREWFRWYKTPDGKPVNGFGHGEAALGADEAKKVSPPHCLIFVSCLWKIVIRGLLIFLGGGASCHVSFVGALLTTASLSNACCISCAGH